MIYTVDSMLYLSFLNAKGGKSAAKLYESNAKRVSIREKGASNEDGRSG